MPKRRRRVVVFRYMNGEENHHEKYGWLWDAVERAEHEATRSERLLPPSPLPPQARWV